jgi:hypothetical protein
MTRRGYFTKTCFEAMQRQVDLVHLPDELGAIPRKIGSSFDHMKGDQVHFKRQVVNL